MLTISLTINLNYKSPKRKVEVEVEVEVEVVEVGQVDQEGLYGAARAANHKKMANGQKDKMTQ